MRKHRTRNPEMFSHPPATRRGWVRRGVAVGAAGSATANLLAHADPSAACIPSSQPPWLKCCDDRVNPSRVARSSRAMTAEDVAHLESHLGPAPRSRPRHVRASPIHFSNSRMIRQDTRSHCRGAGRARSDAVIFALDNKGAGKAGCRPHPWSACRKKCTRQNHRYRRIIRPSLRDGFTAYTCSPR
jgi:hypothetical protein